MKKLLFVVFLFNANFAFADASVEQMSTCTMTNFVASKRYEAVGNTQMKNKYFSESQYWLHTGESKFGESTFGQKIKIVGPSAMASSDAELTQINKNCAVLKSSIR